MPDLPAPRPAHPVVFLLLLAPFGAVAGFVSVAIGYRLAQAGLPVVEIGGLVGSALIPHSLKFLWAPLVDTRLSRKTWYRIGCAGSAAGILAISMLPATARGMPLLYAAVLGANLAATLIGMTGASLMAWDTPLGQKGRASGWSQAGNTAGSGFGGGAGLWMAQHLAAPWMAGAVIAVACIACSVALAFVREPPALPRGGHFGHDLAGVARDLWSVARSRTGALGMLICFLPLGSAAASNLWSAIAGDWGASADTVALVTGAASGGVAAAGCFIGGWFSDRLNRQLAYALFGVLLALSAAAMAVAPHSETMYILFTSLYSMLGGVCIAGWSAVTLEAIGTGAAATKWEIFGSLSNVPIGYLTVLEGWAQTRWGSGPMLLTDTAVGLFAAVIFAIVARVTRRPAGLL